MPTTKTFSDVTASSSSLRTELNIVAAVVAVGICLVILALLANTPPPSAGRSAHVHAARPAAGLTSRPTP